MKMTKKGPHEQGTLLDVAHGGQAGDETDRIDAQLPRAAGGRVLDQVAGAEFARLGQPLADPGQPRHQSRLQHPAERGEVRRQAPHQDEPEHGLVVSPQAQPFQGDPECHRPDRVVHERLAALACREEGVAPAVLQHQAGQRDTERDEGDASRAAEYQRREERADPQHQAHERRGCGAAPDRTPPYGLLGVAEPHKQRVGGQPAGGVEHEGVRHVRDAERAELGRAKLPGNVKADRGVAEAGHHLVRQAPGEPARDLADQPGGPRLRRHSVGRDVYSLLCPGHVRRAAC